MGLTISLRTSVVNTLSYLGAAGDSHEIVVVLPDGEPHRGGFETQQYVIQLGMLERTQTQVVLHSNMFATKNRAS